MPWRRITHTGQKAVALGASALAILAELPREGEYVLPAGRGKEHYTGLGKDWRPVRERAELPDFRVHDLRARIRVVCGR